MYRDNFITGKTYYYPGTKKGTMFFCWVCWLIDLHVEIDEDVVLKRPSCGAVA